MDFMEFMDSLDSLDFDNAAAAEQAALQHQEELLLQEEERFVMKTVKVGSHEVEIKMPTLAGALNDKVYELNVNQRSPAWHAERAKRRTASQSPTIMGLGYGSLLELYYSKIGAYAELREIKESKGDFVERITQFGNENEKYAAEAYLKYKKLKKASMKARTFIRGDYLASFDLISSDLKQIAEIKCPYQGKKSTTWKEAAAGRIDKKYIPQLEHQLLVAGQKELDFVVFDAYSGDLIVLKYETNFNLLVEIHQKWDDFFINHVLPRCAPEKEHVVEDEKMASTARQLQELKAKIAALEAQIKPLENELKNYAKANGYKKIALAGTKVSISREVRRSLDEELLKKEAGDAVVNIIEACKTKETVFYTIRMGKKDYDLF